jgi:anti-sigma-K factor RskA
VLGAEERRAVEQRLIAEPALAREVAAWEEHLGGMASYVNEVTPPVRAWMRIEASMSAPATALARPATLWNSLAFWRGFGIGAAGLATACLAALVYVSALTPPPQPARTPFLATLNNTSTKQPNFVAAIGADGMSLTIVPAALLAADKLSMELWLIPQGGKPHSLGLIAPSKPVQINVPRELLEHLRTDAALAVSLEPLGGSPTGQPTGEVIAVGNLTRL